MTKTHNETRFALAQAVTPLEEDLARFESLAETALRVPLNSQKNLERAARANNEAAECQTRLGGHIQALVNALNRAREQNEATANRLKERTSEIEQRSAQLGELLERFGLLGETAREISASVLEVGPDENGSQADRDQTTERLRQIEVRMTEVVSVAVQLTKDANSAGLTDLAQKADSIRQQIQAAKNKVALLIQRLPSPAAPMTFVGGPFTH